MKTVWKLVILFIIRALLTPTLAQSHVGVGSSLGPPLPVHEEIVVVQP